jgi:hypothetical protein
MDVDQDLKTTGQLIRDPAGSGPNLDIFVAVEENVSNRCQISVVGPGCGSALSRLSWIRTKI